MSGEESFRKIDEAERIYAPEPLPPEEQERVVADEGAAQVTSGGASVDKPPAASDGLLFGLTTEADVTEDEDQEGSNGPHVLPPLPIRSGPGMGQIG